MKKTRETEFGNVWCSGETPARVQERLGNSWMAWTFWALVLEQSAEHLEENAAYTERPSAQVVMPAIFSVRAMLLGYAIECAMKSHWVKRGNKLVKDGKFVGVPCKDHDLLALAKIIGFSASQAEAIVLARLTKFVRFAGRYPIAKKSSEMSPEIILTLGPVDTGFFSKQDFRVCLSILKKIMNSTSGKKRRVFPRRPRSARLTKELHAYENDSFHPRRNPKSSNGA